MKKAILVQDQKNKVPLEVVAQSLVDISEGIKKLQSGPLNEKALLLLIQHSTKTKGRGGQRYAISEIKDVLQGIESLAATYLKKEKKHA